MMAVLQWLLLLGLVQLSRAQGVCPADGCTTDTEPLLPADNNVATDHYYIGGMFGMHYKGADPYQCGRIRPRGLLNAEAFFWAIKTYQRRHNLNVGAVQTSVGGFVLDSCSLPERTIENLYGFDTCRLQFPNVNPRNTIAFVGPDTSTEAMEVLHLMEQMQRTAVAHSATSPQLSGMDGKDYKYFLRTVPATSNEAMVMAEVLDDQGYKYVQAIYEDTAYGMGILHAFEEKAKAKEICIVAKNPIHMNNLTETIRKVRQNEKTRVLMVFAVKDTARKILQAFNTANENNFLFVGTSSWADSEDVIDGLYVTEKALSVKLDTASYSISPDVDLFYTYFRNMKPADNTYNPYFAKFWEEKFGCSLAARNCDLTKDLSDVAYDPYVPFTLMAVDAIISATTAASRHYCNGIHLCSELLNRDESRGVNIWNYIVNSLDPNGRRYFENNGETAQRFIRYQVLQVKLGQYKHVVDYNELGLTNRGVAPDKVVSQCPEAPNRCVSCGEEPVTTTGPVVTQTTQQKTTTPSAINQEALMKMLIAKFFKEGQEFTGVWRNQTREDNDSLTRFEIGHDWIIAIGVLAGLGIVCVLVFEIYILYKLMGTKIGKQWRTMWLGQLLLFGLFLCYLVLIAYIWTPTKATCCITRLGVGISYSICFAVLLVKLMVLLTSKSSADNLIPGDMESPNYLRGIYQFLMFVFVVGVQVVIAIMWLIMVPPDAVQVTSNNGEKVWICNHYTWTLEDGWENMASFVRTDFENHLISLSYIMVLILITAIVAMKAHGIITNHRESVFIGIAAGFSIPIWIAWGLVGGLNKDHEFSQEFGDASMAFGLFATATLIMFSMFLPKVRQLVNMGVEGIYLEDDRETYYAGSVIMAPPSYKSRPSSVMYVNSNGGYNEPVMIGDQNALHVKHPGSNYSAPVYVKRPDSTIGGHSGRVLKMTGDLTGKHPKDSKKPMSEMGYAYAGSGYGGTRTGSEKGFTLRKARSSTNIGAL